MGSVEGMKTILLQAVTKQHAPNITHETNKNEILTRRVAVENDSIQSPIEDNHAQRQLSSQFLVDLK